MEINRYSKLRRELQEVINEINRVGTTYSDNYPDNVPDYVDLIIKIFDLNKTKEQIKEDIGNLENARDAVMKWAYHSGVDYIPEVLTLNSIIQELKDKLLKEYK